MIYYSCLLGFILLIRLLTSKMKSKINGQKIFFILSCFAVIVFQGLRSFSVGTDLKSYLSSYIEIGKKEFWDFEYRNFEIGYVFLNKILNLFGFSERGFLFIIAILIQVPIFLTIYRYSEMPLFSILWYFAFGNFIMTFSGLRQSIAMAACFSAYHLIKRKKLLWFLVVVLLASLFHKSALFCLLLYPVFYIKMNDVGAVFALLLVVAVFIFRKQIFSILSSLYYGETRETTSTGAYTMFAVYFVLFVISFLKYSKDRIFYGFRNILLLLVLIYALASVHDYITRIGFPLTLYMTLFMPKLIKSFNITPSYIYYGICSIVCILCFYCFLGGLNTLPFSFG